ncbi:MAG: PAS domain S-box protein [Gammaproteobacteria bacterium]|nr:PAS domain S-box protein [Gammaproteobacteria bacterium]
MKAAAGLARRALERRGRQLRWIGGLLALLVPVMVLAYLGVAWRDIKDAALARQGLYSRVLDAQTDSILNAVASNLRAVSEALEANPIDDRSPQVGRTLRDAIAGQPALRSLSILDGEGRVLASSSSDNVGIGIDIAALGARPKDSAETLGAWLPIRELADMAQPAPRREGLAALAFLRRVQRPGQPELLLVGLLNLDHFATQHEVLLGDAATQSALFSYEGRFLSGGSSVKLQPGNVYPKAAAFAQFLPQREHAEYIAQGMDGPQAVGAFRTLRNWPLVVVSEQDEGELMDQLYAQARRAGLAALAAWFAIAAVVLMSRRNLDNEARAQQEVAQLHAEVLRNEERWKRALEGAGDGVWEWNLQSGEARYSPRCRAMLGYDDADVGHLYVQWAALLHPEDIGRLEAELVHHIHGRHASFHLEVKMRCKTGEWKWVLMRGMATQERDSAGTPVGLAGTMTDITERKAADAALAASQARQTGVLQSSMDAIVIFDGDARVVDFNPAAEAMFGRPVETAIGKPITNFVPSVGPTPEASLSAPDTGRPEARLFRRTEAMAVRANGAPFAIELTVVPVRANGERLFTATMRDITERQRVELALRDSEARARATFDQAAVGMFQLDAQRRFLRVNQTLCRLLAYSPVDLLQRDASVLTHPDELEDDRRQVERLFAGEIASLALERRYRRSDGRYVWVRLTASIAQHNGGEKPYMIGIVEDIGVRRQAQDDLRMARQRELEIGARIQQSLLVTAPSQALAGVCLSSYTHASQDIDGDFFEVVRPADHCIDLISGDVMGKGVNAALMGAAVKMQFSRSFVELMNAARGGGMLPEPADVLAAVHRAMTPHLQALDAFVTVSYVRLDVRRGTLQWAGCGHEEALLVRRSGELVALTNQQPPLGVLTHAEFLQDVVAIEVGDSLLVHSDGLSDAMLPDGERIGQRRVRDASAKHLRDAPTPGSALHGLRRELLADATCTDDLTMVVVRICQPDARRRSIELAATADSIGELRRLVEDEALASGMGAAERGLFAVAVIEVFTNIYRHGRGLFEQAPVEAIVHRTAEAFEVELVHLGEAFTPPADPSHTAFEEYPDGGFGLTIIRKACDRVDYEHAHGVSTVRLTRWLAAHGTAARGSVSESV